MAKLEREGQRHELNVWEHDYFEFWQTGISGDDWNVTLKDRQGGDVLRLYGVSPDQLADLSLTIGEVLGRAPDVTQQHIRKLRDELNRLLGIKEATADDPNKTGLAGYGL